MTRFTTLTYAVCVTLGHDDEPPHVPPGAEHPGARAVPVVLGHRLRVAKHLHLVTARRRAHLETKDLIGSVIEYGQLGGTRLERRKEGRKEMFYLTTHSTHFIFTAIWRQTYGKGPF